MSHNLAPEKRREFAEIFALVDKDGSGEISRAELEELMGTLQIDTNSEEIDNMIAELDEDSNGCIDFEEFCAVMSRKVSASYSGEQVQEAFKLFTTPDDPSGTVSLNELVTALTTHGSAKLSIEEATALLVQLEPDAEGRIDYEGYVSMMMNE